MDFTTIGKIGSYVRQKNLAFAANYKIKTGQRITDANGNLSFAKSTMFDQLVKAQKKSNEEIKAARLTSIKQKLMSGRKLSTEEMGYLRDKDPETYKKAKHADEAREELKAELKHAKTKQEARQAVAHAMVKACAEASAELSAYKSALNAGGGGGGGASVNLGGDANAINLPNENFSGADSPSLPEINAQVAENNSVVENPGKTSEKNSAAQKFSEAPQSEDTAEKNNGSTSYESILEKFIMTVRALEDEWENFTKSKEYQELPEDFFKDTKKVFAPNNKTLNMISTYRKAMAYGVVS